jgi:hypothetical protein
MSNPAGTSSAERTWRRDADRLASEYRAEWGDARRPATAATEDEKAKAFNDLMRDLQAAWRRFAARDPAAASQILCENISATARPGEPAGEHQAW